ncbi:3-hydroxybutyrate dehydrogenase type 2, partial [Aphelenchoides avenae]
VNNAGVSHKSGDTDLFSVANYDYIFSVNLRSVVHLTQLAVPHLEKTTGNVVNVSSVGAVRPFSQLMYYCMAKAAVDHFTRSMAGLLAGTGVRVNGVNSGGVKTSFNTRHGMSAEESAKMEDAFMKKFVPLQRIAEPREIANVLKFLASDEASYVNGATWVVDGGTLVYQPSVELDAIAKPTQPATKRSSSKAGKRASYKNCRTPS